MSKKKKICSHVSIWLSWWKMHTCLCVCICLYMYMFMGIGMIKTRYSVLHVCLNNFSAFLLKESLALKPELTNFAKLVDQRAPDILLFPYFQCWDYWHMLQHKILHLFWESKLTKIIVVWQRWYQLNHLPSPVGVSDVMISYLAWINQILWSAIMTRKL